MLYYFLILDTHHACLRICVCVWEAGPQKENFPGGTKVDTGPSNLIGGPQALSGPTPLSHFLWDGCRSLFKSDGITIFAHS